jgi:general secretion pathway protein F
VNASTLTDAYAQVDAKGIRGAQVFAAPTQQDTPTTISGTLSGSSRFLRPAPASELALFFRQLGAYIHSGLSAAEAFGEIGGRTKHNGLRKASLQIAHRVRGGQSIASAARAVKLPVAATQLGLLEIGESTGTLELACAEAALSSETDLALSKGMAWTKWLFWQNIWAFALIAPMVRGVDATQLSHSLKLWGMDTLRFGIPSCLALHFIHFLFLNFRSTNIGAMFVGKVALLFPISRRTVYSRAEAAFVRSLGQGVKAGLPLGRSIELAASAVDNAVLQKQALLAAMRISRGGTLADVTSELQFLSDGSAARIATGERTGTLEVTLKQLADSAQAASMSAVEGDRAFRTWGSIVVTVLATVAVTIVVGVALKDAILKFADGFAEGH